MGQNKSLMGGYTHEAFILNEKMALPWD